MIERLLLAAQEIRPGENTNSIIEIPLRKEYFSGPYLAKKEFTLDEFVKSGLFCPWYALTDIEMLSHILSSHKPHIIFMLEEGIHRILLGSWEIILASSVPFTLVSIMMKIWELNFMKSNLALSW